MSYRPKRANRELSKVTFQETSFLPQTFIFTVSKRRDFQATLIFLDMDNRLKTFLCKIYIFVSLQSAFMLVLFALEFFFVLWAIVVISTFFFPCFGLHDLSIYGPKLLQTSIFNFRTILSLEALEFNISFSRYCSSSFQKYLQYNL